MGEKHMTKDRKATIILAPLFYIGLSNFSDATVFVVRCCGALFVPWGQGATLIDVTFARLGPSISHLFFGEAGSFSFFAAPHNWSSKHPPFKMQKDAANSMLHFHLTKMQQKWHHLVISLHHFWPKKTSVPPVSNHGPPWSWPRPIGLPQGRAHLRSPAMRGPPLRSAILPPSSWVWNINLWTLLFRW